MTKQLCSCGKPAQGSIGTFKEIDAKEALKNNMIPLPGISASPGKVAVNVPNSSRWVCKECYDKIFKSNGCER